MRRKRLFYAGLLLAAVAGTAPLPAAPANLSTQGLIGQLLTLPDWLEEFEAIVGPLHRDRSKWEEAIGPVHRNVAAGPIEHLDVAFFIDPYHFDPQEETNAELTSWQVLFRGERESAVAALKERFGDGVVLDFAPGQPRRFGPLYLTSLAEGRFELAWYAEEPQWAVRPRSVERERALEDHLIAFLRAGVSDATVNQFFPGLSKRQGYSTLEAFGDDWRAEVSRKVDGSPSWVSIDIRGVALDATRLIATLDLAEPGLIATDVHLSGPYLVDLRTGKRPIVDGYDVTVKIDHDLLESVTSSRPGTAAWKPKSWRIRGLWLNPADR